MASESILVRMGLDARPFQSGLTKSKAAAVQFQQGLGSIGLGTVSVAGLTALVASTNDVVRELKWLEAQSGVNIEEIQRLQFAAGRTGAEVDNMTGALEEFSNRIGEASEGAATMLDRFERYNIELRDGKGNLRSTRDLLGEVAERMKAAGNASQRAFIADEFFGGDGAKLVNLLKDGEAGIKRMTEQAEMFGVVIKRDAADGVSEFAENIKSLSKGALAGFVNLLGGAIARLREGSQLLGAFFETGDLSQAVLVTRELAAQREQSEQLARSGSQRAEQFEVLIQAARAIEALEAKLLVLQGTEHQNYQRIRQERDAIAQSAEQQISRESENIRSISEQQKSLRSNEAQALRDAETEQRATVAKQRRRLSMLESANAPLNRTIMERLQLGRQINEGSARAERLAADALKLDRQREELQKRIDSARDIAGEKLRETAKFQDAHKRRLELEVQLEQRRNALIGQRGALIKQLGGQQSSLAQSKGDRSLFTLDELANYRQGGFGSEDVLADAAKARRVMELQRQAESARFDFGNVGRSQELFGQADAIRKTISNLKSTERPFANMEEGIKGMKEQIAALNEKAAGEGIVLKKVIAQ